MDNLWHQLKQPQVGNLSPGAVIIGCVQSTHELNISAGSSNYEA